MAEPSRPGTSPPPESAGPFASSWRRRHLTVDERVARGLAARQEAPRSSHGQWEPAPDRPDPVTLLEQQAASRVPDLVPLFLQVKEAQSSVLERFLGSSTYSHRGERVVAGQRLMQAATDIFLGWQRIRGMDGVTRDYYVRQFQDWKGSADVETLLVPGATVYARICGATLARTHARWGDRIAIASYLGKSDAFDRAIADFSMAYADRNERDYAAFAAAVDSGRLAARTGV